MWIQAREGGSRFLLPSDKKYLSRVSYARTLAGTRFVHQSLIPWARW